MPKELRKALKIVLALSKNNQRFSLSYNRIINNRIAKLLELKINAYK